MTGVSDPSYVYVDWGEDFAAHHGMSFPHFSDPGLFVGLGPLALDYIVRVGGAGYFRRRAVHHFLASGQSHLVPQAPTFTHPVYAVYPEEVGSKALDAAVGELRELAAGEGRELAS